MLERLDLAGNQLTTLDLSNNINLGDCDFDLNYLTTLDISNNNKIYQIEIQGMPSLTEVCVWTLPFPPRSVYVRDANSPNIYFTTECSK